MAEIASRVTQAAAMDNIAPAFLPCEQCGARKRHLGDVGCCANGLNLGPSTSRLLHVFTEGLEFRQWVGVDKADVPIIRLVLLP